MARETILYGTISQDGGHWSVQFAYQHHKNGGGCSSRLSGYGQETLDRAAEENDLHPEAVVIDFRTADRSAVAKFAISGPMADDGRLRVERGQFHSFVKNAILPLSNGHEPSSLDFVNWEDRAINAANIGATVTRWTR